MYKVGITGGIGSGKSVVCQVFAALGVPVFNADDAARYLMEHDEQLKKGIIGLFGEDVYRAGKLERGKITSVIFKDPAKLTALNALVHPATILYGDEWMSMQKAPYVIKEAAILFESGSYRTMDFVIGVFAPRELRINRVMKRSGHTHEKVLSIIAQQMDEDEKMKRCDLVIVNDDCTALIPQVLKTHEHILEVIDKK